MPINSLRDLERKKIMVGTREGGTRRIATQLLRANDITGENTTFINEELGADAAPLKNGQADAAILVLAADADKIQSLLQVEDIRLMDFSREVGGLHQSLPGPDQGRPAHGVGRFQSARAFGRHHAADHLRGHRRAAQHGAGAGQPAHPRHHQESEIGRSTRTATRCCSTSRASFPSPNDPELQVAEDARYVYKSGELPFTLRVLAPVTRRAGVPFSYTSYASNHAAKLVLLIPVLAVLLPLTKGIPALYTWIVRRRLLYWYDQLKALERNLDAGGARFDPEVLQAEFDRIDRTCAPFACRASSRTSCTICAATSN